MQDEIRQRIKDVLHHNRKKLNYLQDLWGIDKDSLTNRFRTPSETKKPTRIKESELVTFATHFGVGLDWLLSGAGESPFNKTEIDLYEPSVAEGGNAPEYPYSTSMLEAFRPILQDLPKNEKIKLFKVTGHSMMTSIYQGDWLVCKKVTLDKMIDGRVYVLIITNEKMLEYRHSGVWVKRCWHRKDIKKISCKSDNADSTEPYVSFRLDTDEIAEYWYPLLVVSGVIIDPNKDIYNRLDDIEGRLEMLESLNE